MLKIHFFGKIKIKNDDKDITENLGNKTIALICLLFMQKNLCLSREKILTYLWPDSNEEAARYNLRFNIWMIKKHIGKDEEEKDFLIVNREFCEINSKYNFKCDVLEIKNLDLSKNMDIQTLKSCKDLFTGDFMEGTYLSNCNEFNEIILFERRRFDDKRIKLLKKLAELYKTVNYETCIEILKEALEQDPYDEDVAENIMQTYEISNKRSAAIFFYKEFKNKYLEGLGIQPSEKLKEIYDNLQKDYEMKETPNISNFNGNNKSLILKLYTMSEIRGFWIGEILKELELSGKVKFEKYLELSEAQVLKYIQPCINVSKDKFEELKSPPPEIRTINIFLKLMKKLSMEYKILIDNQNGDKIDALSEELQEYLIKNAYISLLK